MYITVYKTTITSKRGVHNNQNYVAVSAVSREIHKLKLANQKHEIEWKIKKFVETS